MISLIKGDIITIEITDMTEEGAGVGHIVLPSEVLETETVVQHEERGITVFVNGGAVLGDTVLCELTKVKKNYALANLKEVIAYSEHRREDVCPYINDCGGCAFGMLNYDAQLELKVNQLKNKLTRIAGVDNPKINSMIAYEPYFVDSESAYRNKAVMAVGEDENGNPIVGFRAAKSHRIIDCKTCKIQMQTVMALADALRNFMSEYGVRAYDSKSGKGIVKSLMVRTAHETKEVMAALTINGSKVPYAEELAYSLDDSIQALESEYSLESIIIVSEQGKKSSGDAKHKSSPDKKAYVLAGKQRIKDMLMGLRFDISSESFYQVNSEQTVKLYEEALRMLDAKDGEKIIDAYCGIGTIGLIAASRSKAKFLGIESVKEAVQDANKNAIRNLIVNEAFIEGRAEEVLPKMSTAFTDELETTLTDELMSAPTDSPRDEDANEEFETTLMREFATPAAIIVDPPRAGMDARLVEAIIKASPRRIVYVSCDQGTLARDVKLLIDGGYKLVETTPCDMFPDTGGLESVSLLSKLTD
ncbi:MAG: 23S rRNA (uracil(1939)-C(5))-methyltransferase RlmD [Firmicutes bacterium]|nr:23S rRNA (uracil(1939)-C(5))-methyltransferase RlmD [Bacillota bacterium]